MKVNIIIPIKNRAKLAYQTICSLYENTPKEDFNLFVFLDGPDSETEDAVRGLRAEEGFWLFKNTESQGPAWCRNTICRLIRYSDLLAPYLYHSDSDVYFRLGWLDRLITTYELFPDVKLLGGGGHPYLHTNQRLENGNYVVNTKDAVPGFTAFMDWEVWDKYGPYNEHRGIMGSEDWKFCQDIVRDGKHVGVIEPEFVVHCGKTNSDGNPATGAELMTDIEGVKIL